MIRSLPFMLLFAVLCAGDPAAAKSFDAEAIASIDELASAVSGRIVDARERIAVRPPGGRKLRLAIVPTDIGRSDIVPELARLMNAGGRLEVADPVKTAAFLKALPPDRDAARELGLAFAVDAVAAVRGYPSEGGFFVLVRIFFAEGSGRQETVAVLLAPSPASGRPVGVFTEARTAAREDLPELPFTARYFRAADLDGDGEREFVFSDGNVLSVYRLERGNWRRVWVEPPRPAAQKGRHVYLDAADIDGNGRMEIVATVLTGSSAFSLVFEEDGGTYRQKAHIPGFVRVLAFSGRRPLLAGEGYREGRMFSGAITHYIWAGGRYVAGEPVVLPKGVGLHGFAEADVGEQRPLLAAFDSEDRLSVYSQAELIWRSEERYNTVGTVLVESTPDIYDLRQRVAIPARIGTLDVDGDGREEIVVTRGRGGSIFRGPGSAELHCLRWTGARLEKVLTIDDVPGAVLDFQAGRRNRDGLVIETLLRTEGGVFSNPGSRMTTYVIKYAEPAK